MEKVMRERAPSRRSGRPYRFHRAPGVWCRSGQSLRLQRPGRLPAGLRRLGSSGGRGGLVGHGRYRL